jgi:hypothetical protein
MLQSLYNTQISERRCVGYCWKHHCYVSATQLKQKECLKKGCDALERYEHEYWRQREITKTKKKMKGAHQIVWG